MNEPRYKVILFNGPPYSGKSTAARSCLSEFQKHKQSAVMESFAGPMKHFLATALGTPYDALEKDVIHPALRVTPRKFLIDLSEVYLKGEYGTSFFGRITKSRVDRNFSLYDFVIFDDSGFQSEVTELTPKPFLVHVRRPGKDFTGDSRSYLENPSYTVENNGTRQQLEDQISDMVRQLVKSEWKWDNNKWSLT